MKKKMLLIIGFYLGITTVFAQQKPLSATDTIPIRLVDIEQLFIKNNLLLLAQQANITASKASIIQARLLPNPTFSLEQTLHGQTAIANDNNIGSYGQRAIQLQQLVLLAGKRNKQIKIQEIGAEISEYQFSELLRGLSYELRGTFYDLYFLQKSLQTYGQYIATIQQLVAAYQEQYEKGNVPYKESIRLQSFLRTLQSEQSSINKNIIDKKADLKILIGDYNNKNWAAIIDESITLQPAINQLNLATLQSLASENRYDYKIQDASLRLEKANLTWQQSLATPDLRIGYLYDRSGSYVNNYHAITLSIDIPVFNKNQGNIKIAESRVKASEKYIANAQITLENEVSKSFEKVQESEKLLKNFDPRFIENYQKLINGIIENYQKRNISLMEFTDFLESYKNSAMEFNTLENEYVQAIEELNFVIGKKVL